MAFLVLWQPWGHLYLQGCQKGRFSDLCILIDCPINFILNVDFFSLNSPFLVRTTTRPRVYDYQITTIK